MNNIIFIKQPLDTILKDTVISAGSFSSTFNTFPVFDYMLQSTFLRMTGCLEQKMKTICWEMAGNDPLYRYQLLSKGLGECSLYKDKNTIFKELCLQIHKRNNVPYIDISQGVYLENIRILFNDIFKDSGFRESFPSSYSDWGKAIGSLINSNATNRVEFNTGTHQLQEGELFDDKMRISFEKMIDFRNLLAHNTRAPLKELPSLRDLQNEEYRNENYFLRFTLLILTDRVFVNLFHLYLDNL